VVALNTKTENEKEKRRIGFFEAIIELGRKLKEEILIFSLVFALIIAQSALITRFSFWLAVTFISIYLLTILSYFLIKFRKTKSELKEKLKDYIKWRVSFPRAFPDPYDIKTSFSAYHFDISFKITNHTKKTLLTQVYICSPSQAVIFSWDSPRKIWQRRFGIILYRKEVEMALDNLETRLIDPNQEETFNFHGIYRHHYAFRDFDLRRKIVLTYRIYAESEEGFFRKIYFDTYEKKIEIPFEKMSKIQRSPTNENKEVE